MQVPTRLKPRRLQLPLESGGRGSCRAVAEPARVQTDLQLSPTSSEASAASATRANAAVNPSGPLPLVLHHPRGC